MPPSRYPIRRSACTVEGLAEAYVELRRTFALSRNSSPAGHIIDGSGGKGVVFESCRAAQANIERRRRGGMKERHRLELEGVVESVAWWSGEMCG